MFKKNKLLYIILILLLVFSVSCKKKENDKEKSNKEEIPQQIKSIEETNEEIITDVEKLQSEMSDPQKAMDEKEGEEEKSSQKDSGGDEESKKEEDKQKEDEKGKKEDEKKSEEEDKKKQKEEFLKEIDKKWGDIGKKIADMHSGWNSFEPKAIEDGAGATDITEFEENLNALTLAAQNHNILDTLTTANEVSFSIARFLDFYKGNADNEMIRIKYYIRKSILDGTKNDWEAVKEDIKNTTPVIERLRIKVELKEKDKELFTKLELSLKDMESVIEKENVQLLKIKRDIVLNNLTELKSATEKETSE